jgi:organic radical activating enzyme
MSLVKVEDVPLHHICPGGIALRVMVPGCVYPCANCPWQNYSDPRTLILRKLELSQVLSRYRISGADIVLIDGCEPAIHDWVLEMAEKLASANVRVVLRTSGLASPLRYTRLGNSVVGFIVDHPAARRADPKIAAAFADGLEAIVSTKRIVEVYLSYDGSKRVEAIASELAVRYGDRIVLHIAPASDDVASKAYKLVRELRADNPFTYLYGDTSYTLTSTVCPFCNSPLVSRHAYGVHVKAEPLKDEAKCPSCGRSVRLIICGKRRPRAIHRELVVW